MRVTFKILLLGAVVSGLSISALHADPPGHKNKDKKNVLIEQKDYDDDLVIIDPNQTGKKKDKFKKIPPGQKKKFKKGPPAHAPAWGYRRKQYGSKYWHFPGADVYYREEDKQYVYLEHGKWRIGHELPDWINVNWDHSIVLKDADRRLKKILEQIGIK
ncbi:MAG: hypothetical protein PWR01_2915 [Clostridiales bacterium]|nr:hypothetical protein [Clostridiales bacterium]MDN5281842.1 hypothetical protein [Candidatus Ozemobacter sp.]